MTTPWDPDQYARFEDSRLRPGLELRDRVGHPGPRAVSDLGCGPGALTLALAVRWPRARITGVDHSPEMLARARAATAELPPGVTLAFETGDVATWAPPRPQDVIFSNACLHWVRDHPVLLPRLMGHLAPGGVLAFQVPLSHAEPSHAAMGEVLDREGLGGEDLRRSLARAWVLSPAEYLALLTPHARQVDVWETCYHQVLEGEDPVLEWVRGTGLRPVLDALEGEERERFLAGYREALRTAFPRRSDGTMVYPFPRLFVVART